MNKLKRDLPIYVLSASLVFLGISNISSADAGTVTDAHVKNLEKYVRNLDDCMYTYYFGIGGVSADSLADVTECKYAFGKFSVKFW